MIRRIDVRAAVLWRAKSVRRVEEPPLRHPLVLLGKLEGLCLRRPEDGARVDRMREVDDLRGGEVEALGAGGGRQNRHRKGKRHGS